MGAILNHIYIHIPFCLKKCAYCDFCSVTDLSLIGPYVDVLCDEIDEYANRYGISKLKTIFFGGGTPSLLSSKQLSAILDTISARFHFAKDIEISVEANPETVTKPKLIQYRDLGVNRISLGVQSFYDYELKYLGRVHSAAKSIEAVSIAGEVFNNLNIDLITALPNQSEVGLRAKINKALGFRPDHISCYELTYEKGTPLYYDEKNALRDDGESYLLTKEILNDAGLAQYEISNYSIPGYECRHNLAYWSDVSYLGFGASAHSYDKKMGIRWSNNVNLNKYLAGNRMESTESANEVDKVITGLRKTEGMSTAQIPHKYMETVEELIEAELLKRENNKIAFTEKGLLLSNQVYQIFL